MGKGCRRSCRRDQGRWRQGGRQLRQRRERGENHRYRYPDIWENRRAHQQRRYPPGCQFQEYDGSGLGFNYQGACERSL